jgi:hypothetical protein
MTASSPGIITPWGKPIAEILFSRLRKDTRTLFLEAPYIWIKVDGRAVPTCVSGAWKVGCETYGDKRYRTCENSESSSEGGMKMGAKDKGRLGACYPRPSRGSRGGLNTVRLSVGQVSYGPSSSNIAVGYLCEIQQAEDIAHLQCLRYMPRCKDLFGLARSMPLTDWQQCDVDVCDCRKSSAGSHCHRDAGALVVCHASVA